jgi:hypothetical protein
MGEGSVVDVRVWRGRSSRCSTLVANVHVHANGCLNEMIGDAILICV